MLTCILANNKVGGDEFKFSMSHHNNNFPSFEDIHSITLSTPNIQKAIIFPILSRVNGWLSANQNSVYMENEIHTKSRVEPIPSRKNKVKVDKPEDQDNKISVVFIRNHEEKLYKLTFHAVQCSVIPLFTKERPFSCKPTDKNLQSHSKSFYYERYTPLLSKIYTRRKDYVINQSREGRNSILSFKGKLGQNRETESKPVIKPKGISASKTNIKKSVVYLNVNEINFKLYPKPMTIDFSKSLGHESLSTNLARDLGLETMDQKKNKGSIIGKCNGDILKFTFSLEDINYQRVPELVSRSSEARDDAIYIRNFSEISNKKVHIPLPRSIYNYKDPMIDIRRRNHFMGLNHIEPRWKTETRKKRLTTNSLCRQVDHAQKAYDATNGSSIIYEGPGTLNKAREGMMRCECLAEDQSKYERWISKSNHENLNQTINENDELEKFDKSFTNEVPDWDLIVYNK